VHVGGAAQRLAAFGFDLSGSLFHLFRSSRRGDYVGSSVRQSKRKSVAYASGAADNHSGLSLQIKNGGSHEGLFLSGEIGNRSFDHR
jgi:hypothetical protein